MKILILCSNRAGAGSIVRTGYIMRELSELGHQIYFVSPVRKIGFQFNILISFFKNLLGVLNKKVDFIWVSKAYPNACLPALVKKLGGAKLILDMDDLSYAYYPKGIIRWLTKSFENFFPKFFDIILVHNEKQKEYLIKEIGIDEEKILFLLNGVDFNIFNPLKVKGDDIRKRLGFKNTDKIIIYLAHLDISVDLEDILNVFKNLSISRPELKMAIVGGGSQLSFFKKLVKKMGLKEKVIFTNEVSFKEVPYYIAMADAAVVYYNKNILGNYYRTSMKLREYLAMAKPVVCNSLGDLASFKDYTFQFSNEDFEGFKKQLLHILYENYDRGRVVKGQKFVKENLEWKTIIQRFNKKVLMGN